MNARMGKYVIATVITLTAMGMIACNNPSTSRAAYVEPTGIDTDSATGLVAGLPLEGDAIMGNTNVVISATVTWEEGLSGDAMRGDEDGDYLRILESTIPETLTGGSVEVWIYPEHTEDDDNYSAGILHKGDELDFSDEAWSLQNWQSERMAFLYHPAGDPDSYKLLLADNADKISTDEWHLVAVTWTCDEEDNVTLAMYIDGQLVKSAEHAGLGPMFDSDGDVLVGSQLPGEYEGFGHMTFMGLIDEISIYDHARSAEEILAAYQEYFPAE